MGISVSDDCGIRVSADSGGDSVGISMGDSCITVGADSGILEPNGEVDATVIASASGAVCSLALALHSSKMAGAFCSPANSPSTLRKKGVSLKMSEFKSQLLGVSS